MTLKIRALLFMKRDKAFGDIWQKVPDVYLKNLDFHM
jgi:hypothetical protein